MKYKEYIEQRLANEGTINASKQAIYKLSKIIGYEVKIEFFNSLEIDGEPNKFELERFQLYQEIAKLTGNFEPDFCIPKIILGEPF